MQKKFTLFAILLLHAFLLSAQTYSDGDISFSFVTSNVVHDSSQCKSTCTLSYAITIQNSFVGDSVKVVDAGSGYTHVSAGNSTGQSPWVLTLPVGINLERPDDAIWGNNLNFSFPETKVISGPDTVYNVYNEFLKAVTFNPCIYDTVVGRLYFDNNGNCVYDAGDVHPQGLYVRHQFYYTNPPTGYLSGQGYLFPFMNSGYLRARYQKSWFAWAQIYMDPTLQFLFPLSACATTSSYYITSLPHPPVNFPLQCSSNIDVQTGGAETGIVRPNIPFFFHPVVNNTGCDSASGTLTVVLDSRVSYSSALSTNPATTVSGNTLQWQYADLSNLNPMNNTPYWNSFSSSLHLTPNNSVNIGDTLCFTVSATFQAGDINAGNNTYQVCFPVVNSYDPNMKEVEPKGTGPEGYIPQNTNEFTYTIHFQNTGTSYAIDVNLLDTLDSDLDPASLRIVGASHTMSPEWLSANVVSFKFDNIYLPDSLSNPTGSCGFVQFKIKPKQQLPIGTQVKNSAAIYFDNNAAIITNTTLNTIAAPNGMDELMDGLQFEVYPNPANDRLNFSVDERLMGRAVTVTDVMGRVALSAEITNQNSELNLSALGGGVYFVTIGSRTKKLIKE